MLWQAAQKRNRFCAKKYAKTNGWSKRLVASKRILPWWSDPDIYIGNCQDKSAHKVLLVDKIILTLGIQVSGFIH